MAFLLISVIFLVLTNVSASESEGVCFDEETGHRWPVGDSYSPIGRCFSMNCISEDGAFDALPCALYHVPEGGNCEAIDEDLTKPYPECCSSVKCVVKDKEKEIVTDEQ